MAKTLSLEGLSAALSGMNRWHQNVPLLLAIAKQKPGPDGEARGNVEAVRGLYDSLFCLEKIGIDDSARKFYLHVCHGKDTEYPYAIRKPSQNYGKTHQRILKDTFAGADQFLARTGEGKYRLKSEFPEIVLRYLNIDEPLDLRPLVLFAYWKDLQDAKTVGDLWKRFCHDHHVDHPPFNKVFTCNGTEDDLPLADGVDEAAVRQMFLPDEFGSGVYDAAFWRRFKIKLDENLKAMKWQGQTSTLVSEITAALMHDQAVFLLGPPGTGKTTLVNQAIIPSLRQALADDHPLVFSPFTLTPSTTIPDLFGFQGLDGKWVMGPLAAALLTHVSAIGIRDDEDSDDDGAVTVSATPHLLFLDEANRIDIEGLLSPIQASLDSMQARRDPGMITLGSDEFVLPHRVWRIFAGNSPAADIGRKEQSRPFKRRLSVVLPPDPIQEAISAESRFKAMTLELLERATQVDDPEVSEPALALLGKWKADSGSIERLRQLLQGARSLRSLSVTVGLVESIVLRAASHNSLGSDAPLDRSLVQTLVGLVSGPVPQVEELVTLAASVDFTSLSKTLESEVLQGQRSSMQQETDPIP